MGILNDTVLDILKDIKSNLKPALVDVIYYVSGCGCTDICE